ncbi:MAG: hypothetical protein ACPGVT_01390 [Maricaulaceae bacterium]
MKRNLFLATGLVGFSFVLGWARAGINAGPQEPDMLEWVNPAASVININTYKEMGERIRATQLFPISAQQARQAALRASQETQVVDVPGPPLFPEIVGFSVVDKVPYVHLLLREGGLMKATEGQSLKNGWFIKSIDRKNVIARYDDKDEKFPIIKYLDDAFKVTTGAQGDAVEAPK